MNKIRVILADDTDCVRVAVKRLVAASRHIRVVAEACDTQTLAMMLCAHECDVVVVDLAMPGLDGALNPIPFLRRLLRQARHPHVIALSTCDFSHLLTGLRRMGVMGIVDKSEIADSLLVAIETVGAGGVFPSHVNDSSGVSDASDAGDVSDAGDESEANQTDNANDTQASAEPADAGALTPREWEVFQLHAQGLAVHQIARRLSRSDNTVSTQKRSAMRKLGAKTDAELRDRASELGLRARPGASDLAPQGQKPN